MIRRPPRSTLSSSSAASDVYKRQVSTQSTGPDSNRMPMDRRGLPALLFMSLLPQCAFARWDPGYWDVGSHDGTMPKCDYAKYPSASFNPDDFTATGSGCDQFPLRMCGHDENLWPGGVHHDNISCQQYHRHVPPGNCSGRWNGWVDAACEDKNQCHKPNGEDDPNCNINIKQDCYCLHKDLFPLLERELVATMAFVLGVFIAACAGIGGGGLNVPFFILLFGFMIKEATPLSHSAVMANSAAQFIINWPTRHTQTDQPVTDYIAPLVLLPAQLAGNNLGVLLSPVIPADALYIMSIGLLLAVTAKVGLKAVKTLQGERAARAAQEVEGLGEKLMANENLEMKVGGLLKTWTSNRQSGPITIAITHGQVRAPVSPLPLPLTPSSNSTIPTLSHTLVFTFTLTFIAHTLFAFHPSPAPSLFTLRLRLHLDSSPFTLRPHPHSSPSPSPFTLHPSPFTLTLTLRPSPFMLDHTCLLYTSPSPRDS
eukprot:TRINITY_DN36054_c0_g1_i4.p1 TRINITY_DN36054_c0_g1~~TRINITY_DN36054_c0_g1_i4.p1  ORF type:complete len:483 (+),score=93.47 TRINITY_DN36054_c0_g1_i4:130-1578(+)